MDNTIDIEKLLETAVQNPRNENITTMTYETIQKRKKEVIKGLKTGDTSGFMKKLEGYRFVDELPEIRTGCYIRWINLNYEPISLTNGGIITSINLSDNGTYITCKNNMNRFFRLKLDDCIVFQKITSQEQIILSVIDHIHKA